jgi:hypothetical protein
MNDRRMTLRLAAALDKLTEAERRHLKTIAPESTTPWLRALLEGLVAEVVVAEAREVTELHAHELDHLQDVEKAAEGAVWPSQDDPGPGASWWPLGKPEGLE